MGVNTLLQEEPTHSTVEYVVIEQPPIVQKIPSTPLVTFVPIVVEKPVAYPVAVIQPIPIQRQSLTVQPQIPSLPEANYLPALMPPPTIAPRPELMQTSSSFSVVTSAGLFQTGEQKSTTQPTVNIVINNPTLYVDNMPVRFTPNGSGPK